MTSPLPLGSVIGVLGGGQLGRMLALAAARLGFDVHIYSDEPNSPAGRVASRECVGSFTDEGAVASFAERCDVVTYEFENVPAAAAEAASRVSMLRPCARALEVSQDRWLEKGFARDCGVPTVACATVDGPNDAAAAIAVTGLPALLKTRRLGYDGKGQAWIRQTDDAGEAWRAVGERSAILEGDAAFVRELSLVFARGADGTCAFYDLTENNHAGGVLRTSRAPAPSSEPLAEPAQAAARAMAEALGYVGVMAVEFFVSADGALTFNEFAPRVHNSGHWTQDGAVCDQFEQHIRAIAGWPLGSTDALGEAVMTNLLGTEAAAEAQAAAIEPGARLHWYGKGEGTPGRKMGHVTRVSKAPTAT